MPDQEEVAAAIARNLRRLRARRGLTLDALAARCSVSRGMLIQIEQARTNPSVGTLVRVADGLGVSVAQLVEIADAPAVRVVRADQTVPLWRGKPGSVSTLLLGSDTPDIVELWDYRVAPGDGYKAEAHQPGTRELLYVLAGTLTLTVGSEWTEASPGDAVVFTADRDHAYANTGDEPLHFVMAVTQPSVSRE